MDTWFLFSKWVLSPAWINVWTYAGQLQKGTWPKMKRLHYTFVKAPTRRVQSAVAPCFHVTLKRAMEVVQRIACLRHSSSQPRAPLSSARTGCTLSTRYPFRRRGRRCALCERSIRLSCCSSSYCKMGTIVKSINLWDRLNLVWLLDVKVLM